MKKHVSVLICTVVFVLCGGVVRAAQDAEVCITCHTYLGGELAQPVTKWRGSVHDQNGITCDYCHGGNAAIDVGDITQLSGPEFDKLQSRAMSKSNDFIGIPAGREMFDMCGQCHDESVARYAGSIMGRAYLDNKGGPSCVACHNAHDNIMPAVPKSCESCHKNTAGFDRIDPMNVTKATINELSGIRIELAETKTKGVRPALVPEFPEEMDTYQIGVMAFGAVIVVFLFGCLVYAVLEKRK